MSGDRLTSLQQGLLFHAVSSPGAGFYHQQVVLELESEFDRVRFASAWNAIVARHDALRTRFSWRDGEPLQWVEPMAELPLVWLDWSDDPAGRLEEHLREDRRRGFALDRAPLARVAVGRAGPGRHWLVLSFHHLILDGWSLAIVLSQWLRLYEDAGAALAPVRPFADYLRWLDRRDDDEAFWRREFGDLTEPTRLWLEGAAGERGPAEQRLALSEEATARLQAAAQRAQVTLATLIHTAWAKVLARLGGGREVIFGVTLSGRPADLPGVEGMVGLFINTLPLRVSADASLAQVQRKRLELEARQHTALTRVQRLSGLGGQPLFDTIVVVENYPVDRALLEARGGLRVGAVRGVEQTHYQVTLVATPGARLGLGIGHERGRLSEAAAKRLLEELAWTLDELGHGRDATGLRPSDAAALATWNRTEAVYAGGWVHEQVLEHVALRPEATAACDDAGGRLSYRELGARSGALAAELGPGVERIAGVLLERTVDLPAALLGVLRAGWAYLPLDPEDPPQRLRELLEGAGAGVVLTERRLEDRLGGWIGRRLYVEEPRPPADPPPAALAGENLAYVLYTSGSTGKPKGVMVTHRGWRNYVSWCRRAYGLDETTTALVHSPLAFDLTVTSLWGPLAAGGMARLLCGGDLETVARALEVPTTLVKATPAHLEGLEALGSAAEVRTFVIGGEALSGRTAAHWRQRGEVINEYGPTETVVGCTIWRAPADFASDEVPIGRPIGNLRAYVLDEGLDPVGPGMAGELYIGGAGVCRGYLGRADLTAERFLPDPYGAAGERMYRTGDRARRRGDGELVYLGRLDDQVKIRGHRIEPGEVEAALLAEPGVRQAVVLALGEGGAKRLVAYVVGEGLSGPDLRERLRRRLPDWLTPSAVVTLAELPRTANGKIDRRALPTPTPEPSRVPAEGLERLLADLWEAVLERRGIGARDNFFELGGDSILSLQIVSRARQRGVRLTPRQVFEHQTIEALAQVALREEDAAPAGPEVGPAPLTPIQRWLTEQELGDPDHWNMAVMVRPREPIDAARLEAAVRQVTAHHGALRLRFDGSVQREAAEAREVFEAVAGAWDAAATQRSLRLSEGPVFKAVWLVEKGRLALVAHHLAVDGVSWRVILEDLEAAYEGRTLAPAAPSYVAWARRLTEQAATGEWRGELAYWRGQPWGEIGPLPVDGEGTNEEGTARTLRREWDEARTRALLEEGPTRWRAQIQETLLTALVRALCGWTGRGAALVAVEGHGRTGIEDLEPTRTVGWFTALYPLVLRGGGSAGEALAEVRARLRGVPGGGQGWGALRYLDAESGLEGFAEPEVSFNYLGRIGGEPGALFTFADEATGPWRAASARRRFLIDFNAVVVDRRLQVHWTYSPARHNPDTIERLAKSFEDELWNLSHSAPERLSAADFPLAKLDEAQMSKLVALLSRKDGDIHGRR